MKRQHPVHTRQRWLTQRGSLVGLGLLWTLAPSLYGCGSEQDKDKSLRSPPPPPRPSPSPRTGADADGLGKRRPVQVNVPGGTQGAPGTCVAAMTVELLLDPRTEGEPQSYLVGRLDPACYDRNLAILRLRIDGGVRLSAGLSCRRTTETLFNFECNLDPRNFVLEDALAIPVYVSSQASLGFQAEIEVPGPATPGPNQPKQ